MPQWTIQKLLDWSAAYFETHRIDSPRATAEILLAHGLGQSRLDLYTQYDKPLNTTELASFKNLIRRRMNREPVAYIIGSKGFWDLEVTVTRDVLIPRPETEGVVENGLAFLSRLESKGDRGDGLRILELGTGSGAIILAIASARPGHRYFASDLSSLAIAVAKTNAVTHHLAGHVHFFSGNWFMPLSPSVQAFDMILSNPPYIKRGDICGLQPEISRFEPRAALDGDDDGLGPIRHIIDRAHAFLNPGGGLLLEIGYDQRDDVRAIANGCGRYDEIRFFKDYSGIDRVVQMVKG